MKKKLYIFFCDIDIEQLEIVFGCKKRAIHPPVSPHTALTYPHKVYSSIDNNNNHKNSNKLNLFWVTKLVLNPLSHIIIQQRMTPVPPQKPQADYRFTRSRKATTTTHSGVDVTRTYIHSTRPICASLSSYISNPSALRRC